MSTVPVDNTFWGGLGDAKVCTGVGGRRGLGCIHSWEGQGLPQGRGPHLQPLRPHPRRCRSLQPGAPERPESLRGGAPKAPPTPRPRALSAPALPASRLHSQPPAPPRPSARDLGPTPASPSPAPAPCAPLLCHFLIPASCFPEAGIRSRPRPVPQSPAPPVSATGRASGRRQGSGGAAGAEPRGLRREVANPRSPSFPRLLALSPCSWWPLSLSPAGPGSLVVRLLVHLGPRCKAALGCSAAASSVPTPAQSCQDPWGRPGVRGVPPARSRGHRTFPGTQNWGLVRPGQQKPPLPPLSVRIIQLSNPGPGGVW